MNFSLIDILVFAGYILLIMTVAFFVTRKKSGEAQTTRDYFLAGNTLPWWAIGTSLIAANISAEQLIGMTGNGFTMGLAIATYELMAAATLLIVGKFFLPVFLEKKIYSMPNFLEMRYDGNVRSSLAILWLILYVFVNVTSILYLGGVCLEEVFKIKLEYAIMGIALFSAIYTVAGGLKAIAYTDFIQVTFLVVGGLLTTSIALAKLTNGMGFFEGLSYLYQNNQDKFKMIFAQESPFYNSLPGVIGVFGFMWIVNLNYWGFNQYITQRALAAKSLDEAQKGVLLAGFLKLLMPLIVVIPGIVAFALDAPFDVSTQDKVYPWLLNQFLTDGIKGLIFAALVAAIVGSLSSKTNSIATIFAMDVYRPFFGKNDSEQKLVTMGRISIVVSLIIGVVCAPFIRNFSGGFQFIQEFTGFFSPGIFVIFLFGLFWKNANAKGALYVAIATLPVSLILYFFFGDKSMSLVNLPFLMRMGISFATLSTIMFLCSSKQTDSKAITFGKDLFKTSTVFNIGALIIIAILIVFYYTFW
ncbi:MAG: sodium/solute symporter [Cytophagales bacterium]|nr:sodium/solute symporter [Cytophagales bacterium]